MILMSEKMTSRNKLLLIKLVPYNKPLLCIILFLEPYSAAMVKKREISKSTHNDTQDMSERGIAQRNWRFNFCPATAWIEPSIH